MTDIAERIKFILLEYAYDFTICSNKLNTLMDRHLYKMWDAEEVADILNQIEEDEAISYCVEEGI